MGHTQRLRSQGKELWYQKNVYEIREPYGIRESYQLPFKSYEQVLDRIYRMSEKQNDRQDNNICVILGRGGGGGVKIYWIG